MLPCTQDPANVTMPEIGLLVLPHRADRKTLQAELGGIHHCSARRARHRQPDLLDEIDVAPVGNGGYGPAQMSRMNSPITDTS